MVKIGRCPAIAQRRNMKVLNESNKSGKDGVTTDSKASGDGILPCNIAPSVPASFVEIGRGEIPRGPKFSETDSSDVLSSTTATSILAVSYPECLENVIAEAERVTSKFYHAYGKGKRIVCTSKSSRVAKSLKSSLRFLCDSRYHTLLNTIEKRSRRNILNWKSELLHRVNEEMDISEEWARKMSYSITAAVSRLQNDLPWLASSGESYPTGYGKSASPVSPLLLDIQNVERTSQRRHPEKNYHQKCDTCLLNVPTLFCDYAGEGFSTQQDPESPRERLRRKIEEHGFLAEKGDSNLQTETCNLSQLIAVALIDISKKSKKSTYSSLTREARRELMQDNLIKKLPIPQLLPLLLSHLKHTAEGTHSGLLSYASSDLLTMMLASMAQNEEQHVMLFVKNITSEFLGSEVEAFHARHEYYLFWSATSLSVRLRLAQRWRSLSCSFSGSHGELGKLVVDSCRYSRFVSEILLMKIPQFLRIGNSRDKRRGILDVLHRYSKNIKNFVGRFGKIMLSVVAAQYGKEVRFNRQSKKLQLSLLFAFTGFQNLQAELLTGVDRVLRKVGGSYVMMERACANGIRTLLSKIIRRVISAEFETVQAALGGFIFVANTEEEIMLERPISRPSMVHAK